MPDCEGKKSGKLSGATTLLTSFKPRQVLLSSSSLTLSKPNMKHQEEKHCKKSPTSLTSEQRVLLYHSICQFLELNGFLKTLKKFRRETDIEKDSWKSCLLNLEEMCHEHLQMCKVTNTKVPNTKLNDKADSDDPSVETMKRTKENEVDDGKKLEAIIENNPVNGDTVKSKKKRKSGANDMSNNVNGEAHVKDAEHAVDNKLSVPSEVVKKSKDKKKKRKHEVEPSDKDLQEEKAEIVTREKSEMADCLSQEVMSKSKKTKEDTPVPIDELDEEKKTSKKRKKSCSDGIQTGLAEDTPFDDSKRRKGNDLNHSVGHEDTTKTPKGSVNEVLEKDGEKSKEQNKTKERNGSAEPRTANVFHRVKADEVEYVDERLQDNSYWAKDGSESGYGAKAEEVLGQVRGRNFRHEKTKKKRGSYRGGKIDFQSHSVKYFYDEDDE